MHGHQPSVQSPPACTNPRTYLWRESPTLLGFVQRVEASAQDDVLDLFDIVVTALFADVTKIGKQGRRDVAHLSPIGFDHINMLGRYAFIPGRGRPR